MICAVWPQLTRISRGRELGQESMCNRVHDRYEYKVARTLAQATLSSRCGCQLCKQHERSNMWYQRELIKNTYSTTAYAGLIARRDLPRFIVYHSDVMWPYYIVVYCFSFRGGVPLKHEMNRSNLAVVYKPITCFLMALIIAAGLMLSKAPLMSSKT
jgi:hypothetical protein